MAIRPTVKGTRASPVRIGVKPSTCWVSRVVKNRKPTCPAGTTSIDSSGPALRREEKNAGGTTGCGCRRSHTTRAASARAATANDPVTTGLPQPRSAAEVKANTNATIVRTEAVAPPVSSEVRRRSISGRLRAAPTNTTSPTGALTNITHSQPSVCVSTPPASSPTAAPAPTARTNIAIARERCGPGAVIPISSTITLGAAIAAPTPCSARAATSTPAEGASPPATEAITKTTTPRSRARRGPIMEPAFPLSRISPPKASA